MPLHVACIMDGNGRWAGRRGLPRTEGHTEGEENLARLVRIAVTRDIGWLTVFGFSTENWIRPRAEVRHILGLHAKLFGRVQELNDLNVRIQWIGRPFETPDARTPKYVQRAIRKAIQDTSANNGMLLTVAFDYGARQELVDAVRRVRSDGQAMTTEAIAQHLYLPELPPVDVLVRTSGEQRVSNFLLWQSAGSAIHFTDKTWPEFDAAELDAALKLSTAFPATQAVDGRSLAGARSLVSVTTPPMRLADVTAHLPGAEDRPGQERMAELVAEAIDSGRHLVVQAGTGTGKTLAYLLPAITSGSRVVVATATKALQDQLAGKDLPFLASALPQDFDWTVLKGRSNYVCLQRLREMHDDAAGQLELEGMSSSGRAEIARIARWVATTETGDGAELDWSPSDAVWRMVSVGSDECPGADRCPLGEPCFAEHARRRAEVADVVVVNTHLYGLHVGSGGVILPEHDVVVFDEAHVLEDVMSDTVGVQVAPGRFVTMAGTLRRILDDPDLIASVIDIADLLREALGPHAGKRLPVPYPDDLRDAIVEARTRLDRVRAALAAIETPVDDAKQRKLRAQLVTGRAIEHLDLALADHEGFVDYVSGSPEPPRLEIAPLDVGPALTDGVWERRTAILTSATIPSKLVDRIGLPAARTEAADVGSPFDYAHQALLYCAMHLPDPRSDRYRDAVHDELTALITAAGGRTLALFTSWKAMDLAAAAVRDRVDVPILTQRELPKPALVARFAADEATSVFATAGFFQGVDVPGRTLSLVVIDRLPFPRPDDPLLSARREAIGAAAFSTIDIPRAAMMLAQASGRLIRTSTDRGVVAVLDRRLGSATYRWDIVRALPPMRRTRDRAEVEAFLTALMTVPTTAKPPVAP